MDYGKKIAQLRKSHNMTQEELGKVLSVTYQAVSKWERGESLPDFDMMSRIAKYFNVPLTYFSDEEVAQTAAATAVPVATAAPAANPAPEYVGMCTQCGKMLTEDEVYEYQPKIICKTCEERIKENEEIKRKEYEARDRARKDKAILEQRGHGADVALIVSLAVTLAAFIGLAIAAFKNRNGDDAIFYGAALFFLPLAVFGLAQVVFGIIDEIRDKDLEDGPEFYTRNLSLIVAGAVAFVNLLTFLILCIMTKNAAFVGVMVAGTIFSFTFISQFMWGGIVKSVFTAGGFTFSLPGFIFSLDIGSIVLMILTKLILGLLSVLLLILTAVVVGAVAIIMSVFTFIPSVLSKSVKDSQVEKQNK